MPTLTRLFPFCVCYCCLVLSIVFVSSRLNAIVPRPYLDEIFHIPQAQLYCSGQYTKWDDKITTPSGPYLVAVVLNRLLNVSCSVASLRAINGATIALIPLLSFLILSKCRRHTTSRLTLSLEAINLALFPVTYFFAFLFYTDVTSLFVVLSCLTASLYNFTLLSAIFGLVSLAFRQTNILWIAFVGFDHLCRVLETRGLQDPALDTFTLFTFFESSLAFISHANKNRRATALIVLIYSPVALAFTVFLIWNEGITLGDKSNHQTALHLPQLMYLQAFLAFFTLPHIGNLPLIRQACHSCFGSLLRSLRFVLISLVLCWIVSKYTIEHPFLLADNRHYPFYVWRKIYRAHPAVPFALTPVYVFIFTLLRQALARNGSFKVLPFAAFYIVCALTLIPSPLIEPRYFIMPFYFLRLHLQPSSTRFVVWETVWFSIINAVTLWVFMCMPFKWASEPSDWQRFMW